MKKPKNVNKYIKEINEILQCMLVNSYYRCKNPDRELSKIAVEVNGDAHRLEVLMKRLEGEYKRERQEEDWSIKGGRVSDSD